MDLYEVSDCNIDNENVTIVSLFADYCGDYIPTEYDWGEPVGREFW